MQKLLRLFKRLFTFSLINDFATDLSNSRSFEEKAENLVKNSLTPIELCRAK